MTIFRGGEGVEYKEIVEDVADKMDVDYNSNWNISKIEEAILFKIFEDSLEKMSHEELKEVFDSLGLKNFNVGSASLSAIRGAINAGGFKSYQIAIIVANSVAKAVLGRGLTFAANAGLTRAMGIVAEPIGWVISGLWTIVDIAGPAFRVTIPSVIHIAYMMTKHQNR